MSEKTWLERLDVLLRLPDYVPTEGEAEVFFEAPLWMAFQHQVRKELAAAHRAIEDMSLSLEAVRGLQMYIKAMGSLLGFEQRVRNGMAVCAHGEGEPGGPLDEIRENCKGEANE